MKKKRLSGLLGAVALSIVCTVSVFANPVDDARAAGQAVNAALVAAANSTYNAAVSNSNQIHGAAVNAINATANSEQARIAAENAAALAKVKADAAAVAAGQAAAQQAVLGNKIANCAAAAAKMDAENAAMVAQKEALLQKAAAKSAEAAAFKANADAELALLMANYNANRKAIEGEEAKLQAAIKASEKNEVAAAYAQKDATIAAINTRLSFEQKDIAAYFAAETAKSNAAAVRNTSVIYQNAAKAQVNALAASRARLEKYLNKGGEIDASFHQQAATAAAVALKADELGVAVAAADASAAQLNAVHNVAHAECVAATKVFNDGMKVIGNIYNNQVAADKAACDAQRSVLNGCYASGLKAADAAANAMIKADKANYAFGKAFSDANVAKINRDAAVSLAAFRKASLDKTNGIIIGKQTELCNWANGIANAKAGEVGPAVANAAAKSAAAADAANKAVAAHINFENVKAACFAKYAATVNANSAMIASKMAALTLAQQAKAVFLALNPAAWPKPF